MRSCSMLLDEGNYSTTTLTHGSSPSPVNDWADAGNKNLNATLQSDPVADLAGFGAYANTTLLYNATAVRVLSPVFSN